MWKALAISSLLLTSATAASAADLTVTINGVHNSTGSVAAAIFNNGTNFPKAAPFGGFRLKASGGPVSYTIHSLPPGKYAITAYHDENDNGKLDADATGLPTEGYGVSNDAKELLGPPEWGKASFDVGDQPKSVTVNITY